MQIHRLLAIFAGALLPLPAAPGVGAQTATQTVTFSVASASHASVSTVWQTAASSSPASVRAGGAVAATLARYAITTNETNQRLLAALDAPLPRGVTITVLVAAPAGAATAGAIPLRTAAREVVTGISTVSALDLPIVYTMQRTRNVVLPAGTRVVTFTITAGV